MTTKKLISDQILYLLSGGNPDVGAFPIDERDIWKSLEQKINSTFKVQQFSQTFASGETIPENLAIATYENVTVSSMGNGKAKSLLPITPISLPRNMGIYLVYNSAIPDNPFIPLQRGQLALLKADVLLNDLMGQIGYEPKNNQIIYTKDITQFGISTVTMELIVFDMSQYSVTDVLPLPADYEAQLINELIQEFSPVTAESGKVNVWTTAGQNQTKQ